MSTAKRTHTTLDPEMIIKEKNEILYVSTKSVMQENALCDDNTSS